jgi:hypothetical protein
MKIFTRISILLLMIISVASCDDLDELTEFDITEDFSATFNIDVAEGEALTFAQTSSINIASNQEIQDNLDLLQDVTLNSLTYEINNFVGVEGATITEASLNFSGTTIAVGEINLQESDTNNTVYSVGDPAQLNAIANELENNTEITATVTGTVNAAPVQFDVIVTLDVTVTVDVL